jgi:toxin-antitoxin system PIN domain toxin
VRPFLLDTNVLIALAWPNHVHHEEATRWFVRRVAAGFRTCPITETGFIRISSNPSFTPAAVTPPEALALLQRITSLTGHAFWPDDLPAEAALNARQAVTYRQVTDGYLLALAISHGGILATLDRGIAAVVGDARDSVELVTGE